MIEAVEQTIIIYIDYFIVIFIVQQFSLNTVNIKKLNLYFIQTSEYLQQFCIDVCYKFDKINIVFNTLL